VSPFLYISFLVFEFNFLTYFDPIDLIVVKKKYSLNIYVFFFSGKIYSDHMIHNLT